MKKALFIILYPISCIVAGLLLADIGVRVADKVISYKLM